MHCPEVLSQSVPGATAGQIEAPTISVHGGEHDSVVDQLQTYPGSSHGALGVQ